ncbi:unnamed protein product [Nezara viridula]|uniref:Uncharacterized protein n=1 Tax=Nezara viridula TaxID=85310 RepID=A0A9P0EBF6_NEZVI|nr:unnamed protein product [Nezara viridula]
MSGLAQPAVPGAGGSKARVLYSRQKLLPAKKAGAPLPIDFTIDANVVDLQAVSRPRTMLPMKGSLPCLLSLIRSLPQINPPIDSKRRSLDFLFPFRKSYGKLTCVDNWCKHGKPKACSRREQSRRRWIYELEEKVAGRSLQGGNWLNHDVEDLEFSTHVKKIILDETPIK